MSLIDTHCHIHSSYYELDAEEALKNAHTQGVSKIINVGTSVDESVAAVEFAKSHQNCWASVGLHPHDSKKELDRFAELDEIISKAPEGVIVGVGRNWF